MNRATRRRQKATADLVAPILANACRHCTPDGRLIPVSDPKARAVLSRAFAHMLRNGGKPHLIRLSGETVACFPDGAPPPGFPPNGENWLGVGLDCEGRGTYLIRHTVTFSADPVIRRRVAEARVFADLRVYLDRAGFPERDAAGFGQTKPF